MLFIAGGERPKPVEPKMDRLAMAATLVSHATRHFDTFTANTDRILTKQSPETGHLEITLVHVAPLTAEQELALDIEVKHCVEDLRSALEYAAMQIYERFCCSEPEGIEAHVHRQVTFPVPEMNATEEGFATKIESVFPELRTRKPDIFNLVMDFRRYASGNEVWIDTLHSAWSEVKHRRLGRDAKPMRVVVPGMVPESAPSVTLHYFPGTTRAVDPNLGAAIRGIGSFISALTDALNGSPADDKTAN
jgi:hypothetical protein